MQSQQNFIMTPHPYLILSSSSNHLGKACANSRCYIYMYITTNALLCREFLRINTQKWHTHITVNDWCTSFPSLKFLCINTKNIIRMSCHVTRQRSQSMTAEVNYVTKLGIYSLSRRTSYCKISWSLEAARFGFRLFQSFCAAEVPVKFQCDTIIITSNLAACSETSRYLVVIQFLLSLAEKSCVSLAEVWSHDRPS